MNKTLLIVGIIIIVIGIVLSAWGGYKRFSQGITHSQWTIMFAVGILFIIAGIILIIIAVMSNKKNMNPMYMPPQMQNIDMQSVPGYKMPISNTRLMNNTTNIKNILDTIEAIEKMKNTQRRRSLPNAVEYSGPF
jgi:hypothetical protein